VEIFVACLDRVGEGACERGCEEPFAEVVAAAARSFERIGDRGLEVGMRKHGFVTSPAAPRVSAWLKRVVLFLRLSRGRPAAMPGGRAPLRADRAPRARA